MSKIELTNGAFRKKKVKFAQVSSVALKDKKLSLRAKGLYALIQNYITLSDFVIYKNYLVSICNDGKSSFDRAWDELKSNGYLVQYQMKDSEGKIYYEYDLLDEPRQLSEEEQKAFQEKEANRIARNKRKIENRKKKENPQVELPPPDKTIDGSSIDGSSTNGTSASINNTDSIHTDLNNIDSKTTTTDVVVVNDEVIEQYIHYFDKKPNEPVLKKLAKYLEKFEPDAITFAFEITSNKAKEFDYTIGILDNWNKASIYTFDEVYEHNHR